MCLCAHEFIANWVLRKRRTNRGYRARSLQIATAMILGIKIQGARDFVSEKVMRRRPFYNQVAAGRSYSADDILKMELEMLDEVDYDVCPNLERIAEAK